MEWDVEYTREFETWWSDLADDEQGKIDASVRMLIEHGPVLDFPYTSDVAESRHPRMRELRIQIGGRPFRVLYCFDPRRVAILLLGGDKTGNARWYEVNVPIADRLYDEHLESLKR